MRYGWCNALSRLCTRLVINTVLPARLKPVTARLTIEPLASSARSNAPENHSERSVAARSNTDLSNMPFAIGVISHSATFERPFSAMTCHYHTRKFGKFAVKMSASGQRACFFHF